MGRWHFTLVYVFPPLPLVLRVLLEIQAEGVTAIVIAPWWPKRPWFPMLWDLSIATPILLTDISDLLLQGRHFLPKVRRLQPGS